MPVQNVSLTPDGKYLDIKFQGGADFHIDINDATVNTNGDGDMDHYSFTNPTFLITTYRSEDAFYFELDGEDGLPLIMFSDSITDALADKLETVIETIIANKSKLNIAAAPHIGVLIEGDDITINDRNSVSLTDFEDGEECVLIRHPNGNFTANGERCFVYHVNSLQGWFDSGNISEPLTRVPITQDMLQRFNYAKPAASAPAARKSRKSRKARKTRRSRK